MSEKEYRKNLVELSNSGYEIVSDEPDIRKWNVRSGSGRLLGVVSDLILDKQSRKVRYIVMDLNGKPLNLLSRRILVPIGISQFDDSQDMVILPNITIENLATLPTYTKGRVSIDDERKIRNVFTTPSTLVDYDERYEGDHFYEHEHFNDTNYSKARRHHHHNEPL